MGDLKFSEVIIAIQNYLNNWGTQAYFCPKMKNFAQVFVSIQNLYYNPKVMKKIITSFILPVMYIQGIKSLNKLFS